MTQCQTTLVPSADCGCTCWLKLTVLRALRASAELMHSLFSVICTAIFIPKNKTHRKYVHLFRPKNNRPKNKEMRFSAPKTKKKTKFGRPLVCTLRVNMCSNQGCSTNNKWPMPCVRQNLARCFILCFEMVIFTKCNIIITTLKIIVSF